MKIIGYQYRRAVALVREGGTGIQIYVAHYPGRLNNFLSGPAEDDTMTRALHDAQPLAVVLEKTGLDNVELHSICEAANRAVEEFVGSERQKKGKRRV